MNILCALGFHREMHEMMDLWKRNRKGQRMRRHYAVCRRCGKRLRWVKSQERQ
ncbi:MAG: hypothetical protein J6K89_07125 [Oscillospiraceae bacterium]|nr:hypothetical protein [Oscillospiraceae bacterium]